MKKKSKFLPIFFTTLALSIGVAISSGVIRNSYIADQAKANVQSGWSRVTAISELTDGGTFIIGYEATANSDVIVPLRSDGAEATTSANGLLYSGTTAGSATNGTINMSSIADTTPYEVTITASTTTAGAINIALADGNFVGNSGSKNTARLYASAVVNTDYTPTIGTNNVVTLTSPTSVSTAYTTLQYNTGSPRFANYNGGQKNVVIYEKGASASLESLSVSGTLVKTSYYVGESFDPAGLTITANYDDKSSEDVTLECTFSPNPLTAGVTSVTASYTEGEVTKTVNIGGFSVSTRSVTSISVLANPTKTSYTIGQSFDPAGMIIRAVYNVGPTNDDYIAYSYAPTSAFASLGEKTITITSTENASAVTSLTVNVVDFPEGTYGITSGATDYQNPMNPDSLVINKSNSELPAVSVSNINNVRLYGNPITGSIMIGSGSSAGASFTISLNSNLYVSKVEFIGNDKDTGAAGTETLAINGASVNFSTINTEDSIVFKPYSNSIDIATSARLWVEEIIITAHTASSSAVDYGTHFLATTADECSSLSVSLGTWNNLKGLYDNADADVQNVIKAADADVGGSDLEKAIARYTYIASKYGYDDFMNIAISSSPDYINGLQDNKSSIAIILVISLIGISVLVGYKLISKKKEA